MNSSAVGTTVRVGNHSMSDEELAAGAPVRRPYEDDDGAPKDPDTVQIWLQAPAIDKDTPGAVYRFSWPTISPGDEGLVQQESTGRFYVDWTPVWGEDGPWYWYSVGAMSGSAVADQDMFFVKRPPRAVSILEEVRRLLAQTTEAVPAPG